MKRAIFFLLFFASVALSQSSVYVDAHAEDIVGRLLVYQLKEAIRKSSNMTLASTDDESSLQIHINTSDLSEITGGQKGALTIYSVAWTIYWPYSKRRYFIGNKISWCGRDVTEQTALSIVATADEEIEQLKIIYKAEADRLKKQ